MDFNSARKKTKKKNSQPGTHLRLFMHPHIFSAAELIYTENALGCKRLHSLLLVRTVTIQIKKATPTGKGLNGNNNSELSEMCGNEIRSAINNSPLLAKALHIAAATGEENQVTQRYMPYGISETEHAGSNKGAIWADKRP